MQLFLTKPSVHMIDTFAGFLSEFSVGKRDMILTESVIYERFLKGQDEKYNIILKDVIDPGEPKEETVDYILTEMKSLDVDRVIAIGGGSVIDIAKVLCVRDAYPCKRVINMEIDITYDKELIVVPTTCGTGSEVTFGGIVTMKETGYKTGVLSPEMSANYAVLIPELIETLPRKVFIHCSVDALGHAMESFVSATRGNEIARAVGARAVKLILDGYAKLMVNGEEYRNKLNKQFLTASCLAGMAVNNGGAGPVHALAYPLGEVYHMSHGESIAQFLTPVFELYQQKADGPLLEELRNIIAPSLKEIGIYSGMPFSALETVIDRLYPMRTLTDAGMKTQDVDPFVDSVFESKQRLLAASYCEFTKEDAKKIYRSRM